MIVLHDLQAAARVSDRIAVMAKGKLVAFGTPDQAITPVYRSDSSGTTAVFTTYLAEATPSFMKDVGAGKTVNWPVGVGGRGNAGVAANVVKIGGAIGYVEYAYAKQNKLTHTGVINKAGKTVQPDDKTFAAAAAGADWTKAPGLGISLNNQPGDTAWPITSASFILMHKTSADPAKATEVLKFFKWALAEGQQLALDLDYVAIDCAETRDGRLLVFEAGTAMIVHRMDPPELFPYKQAQMDKVCDAFIGMLRARAGM